MTTEPNSNSFDQETLNNYLTEKRAEIEQANKARLIEINNGFNDICIGLAAGDKQAILNLIETAAEALSMPVTMPEELRTNLSDGLKQAYWMLYSTKGFIPHKRGKLSASVEDAYQRKAELTAMRVEYCRNEYGLSIEKAKEKVAQDFGINEHTIDKEYKRNKAYVTARSVFVVLRSFYDMLDIPKKVR